MVAESSPAPGSNSSTSPAHPSGGTAVSLTIGTPGACAGKAGGVGAGAGAGASAGAAAAGEGDGCGCGPLEAVQAATAAPAVTLIAMRAGGVGRLLEASVGADDAAMLRAMGLVPGAMVRVCRTGEPCIVAVLNSGPQGGQGGCGCGGSRIGLASALAKAIRVVPV